MRVTYLPVLWVIVLAALSGCTNSLVDSPRKVDGPVRYPYNVVATTGMVSDIVSVVAGDKGRVRTLIGDGVDPHLFKPTRADVLRLSEAEVVFYSGHLLEGKMTDALYRLSLSRPVYAVTEAVDRSFVLEPPEMEGHPDPHMWMDVQGWMAAVRAVKDDLCEYDPSNKSLYEKNCANYLKQLDALDRYAREAFASVPKDRRVLVTAHDAFGYMGRAYDLEVKGIQGLSTESEAGLADLNALVQFLVDRKIQAVFVETSVAEKNVEALLEGARAKGAEVKVGGSLFSDAMGEAGTYEGTYIGMIDHNVTTIVRALGGKVPPKGFQGKLS